MEFYDTHAHTLLSFDSKEHPRNYLSPTVNTVAFTEHLEMDYVYVEGGELVPDFDRMRDWQKEWAKEGKQLLLGVEIGYSSGNHDKLSEALAPYAWDLKLLSAHHNKVYDFMDTKADATPEEMIDSYLTQLEEALDYFSDAHQADEHFMRFGDLINLLDKYGVENVAQFHQQQLSLYPLSELKKRF